jgi:glutamate racemase
MRRPIGIFDSGIGGLTVMKEIAKVLPHEDILYFGDIAHTPYGPKSPHIIKEFAERIVRFLIREGVKIVVVACNTVSSVALQELKGLFPLPILGVIEPGVKKALELSKNLHIGVIGTEATIRSNAYQKKIKSIQKMAKVYAKACPLFVPLVEEGWEHGKVAVQVAKKYLSPLLKKEIDTLILGCTHYPLLQPTIKKVVGRRVRLVDASKQLAEQVKEELQKRGKINMEGAPSYRFFVTDAPEKFLSLGKRIMGSAFSDIVKMSADV